jgi:hypothetical protein
MGVELDLAAQSGTGIFDRSFGQGEGMILLRFDLCATLFFSRDMSREQRPKYFKVMNEQNSNKRF